VAAKTQAKARLFHRVFWFIFRALLLFEKWGYLFHKRVKGNKGKRGQMVQRDIEKLASIVVDCSYNLHRDVGPGLLESVYEMVLANRLEQSGLRVQRQVPIAVEIDGIKFADGFRADLFIDNCLLIEIKSVERLSTVHIKQTLTYLRFLKQPLGLLINFGDVTFREGVKRIMNNHSPPR
jgi:GxxExxY protein